MLACMFWYKFNLKTIFFHEGMHEYLLDISRQLACMKLGSRGEYQPIQYCWVHTSQLLGYLLHTCHLLIDIQQIYCNLDIHYLSTHNMLLHTYYESPQRLLVNLHLRQQGSLLVPFPSM